MIINKLEEENKQEEEGRGRDISRGDRMYTSYIERDALQNYLYIRKACEIEKEIEKYCLGSFYKIAHWSFHPHKKNVCKLVLLHGEGSWG